MGVEIFAVSDRGGSADGRDNPMCGKQELREAFFVVGKTRVTCGFAPPIPKKNEILPNFLKKRVLPGRSFHPGKETSSSVSGNTENWAFFRIRYTSECVPSIFWNPEGAVCVRRARRAPHAPGLDQLTALGSGQGWGRSPVRGPPEPGGTRRANHPRAGGTRTPLWGCGCPRPVPHPPGPARASLPLPLRLGRAPPSAGVGGRNINSSSCFLTPGCQPCPPNGARLGFCSCLFYFFIFIT